MSIRTAATVFAVAGLGLALPAAGQSIPWLTASTGNWSDSTKWTGGNVPNVAGESAVLGLSSAYTVTQNLSGLTLDAIDITNASVILNLGGNTTTLLGTGLSNAGTVVSNSGTCVLDGVFTNHASGIMRAPNTTTLSLRQSGTNNGLIEVNPTGSGSTTTLRVENAITIDGSGEITLNAPTSRAQITATLGGSLTSGVAHTIRGFGQITAPLTNNGLVLANVPGGTLNLSTTPKTNNGTIRSSGGILQTNTEITQGASGVIDADGSLVAYSGATVTGGTITSSGAGRHRALTGPTLFNDVDSDASVEIANAVTLALGSGSFTNDGAVDVNYNNGGSATTLRIDGPLTIDGTGEIIMRRPGSLSQITAGAGGHLTLGAGQTIRGRGQITVPMTNEGLVAATDTGETLLLSSNDKTNNALMGAFGGELEISSITITQGPDGEIESDGSLVELRSATIASGTVRSANGGLITAAAGSSTLSNVDSEADVVVANAALLALAGGNYTNNGRVTVNPMTSGSTTTLRMDDAVVIDGAGQIILNAPDSRAQITNAAGGSLTLGSGQTVRGFGQITALTTNNGLIDADVASQTLTLSVNDKANNGTIRASGGTVELTSITIAQDGSGLIHANGSDILLANTVIQNGSTRATSGGVLRANGGTSTIDSVNSEGPIHVANAMVLVVSNSLTNNGVITVNPTGSGSTTTLRISGDCTIDGTGEIVLNSTGSRAQIQPDGDATLVLGPGQTLRGIGQVGMPMTIEGTVAPGLSVGTLTMTNAPHVVTWQPTSSLDIELGSAASFDKISSGSHTINGGSINITLVDGYAPALFTTHTIIDGTSSSVISGRFDAVNGPALPEPWVWRAGYLSNDVVVGITCPADFNSDFGVDILDFLDFIDDFSICDQQPGPCGNLFNADYNGDTFVDILDFLDFIDAFATGC